MKLILCTECRDLVSLSPMLPRPCDCGKSLGAYINLREVAVKGPCKVVGILNDLRSGAVTRTEAFIIEEPNDSIRRFETFSEFWALIDETRKGQRDEIRRRKEVK